MARGTTSANPLPKAEPFWNTSHISGFCPANPVMHVIAPSDTVALLAKMGRCHSRERATLDAWRTPSITCDV